MNAKVGTTVHYQSYGTPKGEYLPQPIAAIVTKIGDTIGEVGLAILNPTGIFFNVSVQYSEQPKPGHWNLIPETPDASPPKARHLTDMVRVNRTDAAPGSSGPDDAPPTGLVRSFRMDTVDDETPADPPVVPDPLDETPEPDPVEDQAPPDRMDATHLQVNRIDRGQLSGVERLPNGYLRCDGYATRAGILTYRNPDGSERREFRPIEEVRRPDSLASLAGVPVTDTHPPQMLDAKNTAQYMRGYTGDTIKMDGDKVAVRTTITDAALITKADKGDAKELSTGYSCLLEETAGVWQGKPYDAIQRNIRYNHLAVVPAGRAGPEVALRLDAAEQVSAPEEKKPMALRKIAGKDVEMTDAEAKAYDDEQTAVAKDKQDAADKLTAAQAKYDALVEEKTRADAAEKTRQDAAAKERHDADSSTAVREQVKARLDLERQAAKVLPADTVAKFDSMETADIRQAVILAIHPEAKLDGKDAVYINGRFDAAMEVAATRVDSTGELMRGTRPAGSAQERQDAGGESQYEKSRKNFIANKGIAPKETK